MERRHARRARVRVVRGRRGCVVDASLLVRMLMLVVRVLLLLLLAAIVLLLLLCHGAG
jgi:hypothetical protein